MKTLNIVTLVLVILGGLNLGVAGLTGFDTLAYLFGVRTLGSDIADIVVGLSALYQISPLFRTFRIDEPRAEATR